MGTWKTLIKQAVTGIMERKESSERKILNDVSGDLGWKNYRMQCKVYEAVIYNPPHAPIRQYTATIKREVGLKHAAVMIADVGDRLVGVINPAGLWEYIDEKEYTDAAIAYLHGLLVDAGCQRVMVHESAHPCSVIRRDGRTFYKTLEYDGSTLNIFGQHWSTPGMLDGKPVPGSWHEIDEVAMCASGLHASIGVADILTRWIQSTQFQSDRTDIRALGDYRFNFASLTPIFEVEYEDDYLMIDKQGKVVGHKARLIGRAGMDEWWAANVIADRAARWMRVVRDGQHPREDGKADADMLLVTNRAVLESDRDDVENGRFMSPALVEIAFRRIEPVSLGNNPLPIYYSLIQMVAHRITDHFLKMFGLNRASLRNEVLLDLWKCIIIDIYHELAVKTESLSGILAPHDEELMAWLRNTTVMDQIDDIRMCINSGYVVCGEMRIPDKVNGILVIRKVYPKDE